jgi:hypothetical protein
MSTALVEPPARLFGQSPWDAAASGRRVTLEERLRATWRAANAEGSADCPLCGSRRTLRDAGAECGSCGTRLT